MAQSAAIDPSPQFFTVDELAEMLRVTPRAIRARVQRDQIPGVFRPSERSILFRRAEILAWIDSETQGRSEQG